MRTCFVVASIVALTGVLAGCDGSSDDSSATTTGAVTSDGSAADSDQSASMSPAPTSATIAPTTPSTPTTTEPATNATETTDAATSEGTTTSPSGGSPEPDQAEMQEFCRASEDVYLANATSYASEPQPASIRAALLFLLTTLDVAESVAPAGLTADPARAAELIQLIDGAFAEVEYEPEALSETGDGEQLDAAFAEIESIMGQLEGFLVDQCATRVDTIVDQGSKLGPHVVDVITSPLVPIVDESGRVRLFVPAEWTGLESLTTDPTEFAGVRASPDLAALASGGGEGVTATINFVEAGGADPAALLDPDLALDCFDAGATPYDDGLYTGELHRYEACTETGNVVEVLTATTPELDAEIAVEFRIPDSVDRALVDEVLETFVAG